MYTDTATDTATDTPIQQARLAYKALTKLKRSDPDTARTPENQGVYRSTDTGGTPATHGKTPTVSVVSNTGDRYSDTATLCLEILLADVDAEIRFENGKPLLRFLRPLERPDVEPERWAKAEELEGLFWEWCETCHTARFDR